MMHPDPADTGFESALLDWIDLAALERIRTDYQEKFQHLWQQVQSGHPPATAFADSRFSAPEWQESVWHGWQAALHQLNETTLQAMMESARLPEAAREKCRFALMQMAQAMAPGNFLFGNPVALQRAVETGGSSLSAGLEQLLADVAQGKISHSDRVAFRLGHDLATTEGDVVAEHPLFQLIQYRPVASQVYRRPLLIVPPCINKYYILDLQPHNSLIRYAVECGHTVFVLSWRNGDDAIAQASWDDYIDDACIGAIRMVQEITGQTQLNALGFCIGGTMLGTAAAVLKARGDDCLASLTLLTTLLDFAQPGPVAVYVDDAQISLLEQRIGQRGLMRGQDFFAAFSSLRANDLVWRQMQRNYLTGTPLRPFDLLFWNADSTSVPGPMFCHYLRQCYLDNALSIPGRMTVNGTPVDLGVIDMPVFAYASQEDHIVPWQGAWQSAQHVSQTAPASLTFVLGSSGHIAGVVNPAGSLHRHFWVHGQSDSPAPSSADTWLKTATRHAGSWWLTWAEFLQKQGGGLVAARLPSGSVHFPVLEAAPGSYVLAKEKSA